VEEGGGLPRRMVREVLRIAPCEEEEGVLWRVVDLIQKAVERGKELSISGECLGRQKKS